MRRRRKTAAAELLGIPVGSPVFTVERVTLLPNERPFEFVQSVVRGDRYSIVLDLVKPGAAAREPQTNALRLSFEFRVKKKENGPPINADKTRTFRVFAYRR